MGSDPKNGEVKIGSDRLAESIIDLSPERRVSTTLKTFIVVILAVVGACSAVLAAYYMGVGKSAAQELIIQKAVKDAQDAATAAATAKKEAKDANEARIAEEKALRDLIAKHNTAIAVLEAQQTTTNASVIETKTAILRLDGKMDDVIKFMRSR